MAEELEVTVGNITSARKASRLSAMTKRSSAVGPSHLFLSRILKGAWVVSSAFCTTDMRGARNSTPRCSSPEVVGLNKVEHFCEHALHRSWYDANASETTTQQQRQILAHTPRVLSKHSDGTLVDAPAV